jgi:hypothetical protein
VEAHVVRVRLRPAWSPADAILGFEKPTVIPCGRLEGHDGPHTKSFQWGPDA